MLEKLNNFFEKYLGISFIVVAVLITISFTLSHYKNSTNNYNAAEVYIGNLTYVVTIDDNNTQIISVPSGQNDYTIKIRSNESIMTNYKLLYKSNPNLTVKYGNISDTPQGNIKNEEKTVTLRVNNTSQDNINLELLVSGGYVTSDISNITIPNGYSEITESFIQLKNLLQTMLAAEIAYPDNESSPNVSSSSGIDYILGSSNTNGQGLYYTEENNIRTYYYRASTNNYIYFAGFCWRILHTNDDGSVKVMYTGEKRLQNRCGAVGNIGSTTAFSTRNKSATIADKLNYSVSSAKDALETWYQTNIATLGESVTSKISDYPFCNDISNATAGTGIFSKNYTLYGAGNRFLQISTLNVTTNTTIQPSFICIEDSNKNTVSNGKLAYPVGLATVDEILYYGAIPGTSSSGYYWTMSPAYVNSGTSGGATIYIFAYLLDSNPHNGKFINVTGTTQLNLDPVISIKSDVYVLSGTGTSEDPYILQ